jgi:hypothetical protein
MQEIYSPEKIAKEFQRFLNSPKQSSLEDRMVQIGDLILPALRYNLFSVAEESTKIVYDAGKDRLLIFGALSFADLSINSGTCQDHACKTYKLFKKKYPEQNILIAFEKGDSLNNVTCLIPTSDKVYVDEQEMNISQFTAIKDVDWANVKFEKPFYKVDFFDRSIYLTDSTTGISTLSHEYMKLSDPSGSGDYDPILNLCLLNCTKNDKGNTLHLCDFDGDSIELVYMDAFKTRGLIGIASRDRMCAYSIFDPKLTEIFCASDEIMEFIKKLRIKVINMLIAHSTKS